MLIQPSSGHNRKQVYTPSLEQPLVVHDMHQVFTKTSKCYQCWETKFLMIVGLRVGDYLTM